MSILVVYGAVWGIIAPINALIGINDEYKRCIYGVLVIVGILIGIYKIAVPKQIVVKIPGTNTKVTVVVEDLLSFQGNKVVPVNEFFDAELGDHVAPHSLHGQVITHLYGGDCSRFADDIDQL